MSEASTDTLRDAIQHLHGCDSRWVAAVPVHEQHNGETVWRGEVQEFELIGHESAQRAYAWSHETEGGRRKFYAVLHVPPVFSAVDAVRASIVADFRAGK